MLLLGKTAYRNNGNGGGGNGTVRTPIEIDLGYLGLFEGDYPTEDDLAQHLNNHFDQHQVTEDKLAIFKVQYGPILDE